MVGSVTHSISNYGVLMPVGGERFVMIVTGYFDVLIEYGFDPSEGTFLQ